LTHTWGRSASPVQVLDKDAGTPLFTADITIFPGMSGGPVFDDRGAVVGFSDAVATVPTVGGGGFLPISFIVPAASACLLLGRLA